MVKKLLLIVLISSSCMSMQTRKGIVEEQVMMHPEFDDIMRQLHQIDGVNEQLIQKINDMMEQLAKCKE